MQAQITIFHGVSITATTNVNLVQEDGSWFFGDDTAQRLNVACQEAGFSADAWHFENAKVRANGYWPLNVGLAERNGGVSVYIDGSLQLEPRKKRG